MKNRPSPINRKIVEFTLIVFLPIFLVFIGSYSIMSHQQSNSEKATVDSALELFANESEADVQNIVNRIGDLSSNSTIQNVLTFNDYKSNQIISDINTTWTIFKNMVSSTAILDSVAIYNKKTNTIISSTGKYDADMYFTKFCNYTDYDYDYWLSFNEPTTTITTLPPSFCTTNETKKTLIPVVFSSIGSVQSSSIIIANIDIGQIIDSAYSFSLPESSIIFLKNQHSKAVYPKIEHTKSPETLLFIQKLSNEYTEYGNKNPDISHKGDKYYISSVSPRKSLLGYHYIAAIPYSEIYKPLYNNVMWFILLLASVLIVYIVVVVLIYKKLYPAFYSLSSMENENENIAKKGLLSHLSENITKLSEQNMALKKDVDNLLPIYQQKIITKILNSTEYTEDSEEEFQKIGFKNDSFMSLAVKIYFSKISTFTDGEATKSDIMTILEMCLKEYYETISLPSSDDTWYAILNIDSTSVTADHVMKHISEMIESLKLDIPDFEIIYGIGNIYSGLEGLMQTHREAINDLLQNKQERKVIIPSNKIAPKRNTLIIDDAKLTNYLIAGRYDKAKAQISEFTSQISPDNPQPYVSILNSILNIMYTNNIELDSTQSSAEIISSLLKRPKEEIDIYINRLIDTLEESTQPYVSKVNIADVIAYIDEHYSEDIYLDVLAEKFNTNSKYLSKRIKQYINIGFKDYLLKLRIDNAKKLLSETDMNINDIASRVGIPRRNTFIGVFKKMVGSTPSEYRKNYSIKK